MKSTKTLLALSSIALALAAPLVSQASATFQGLTFTFNQTDADTLTFQIQGTPTGNWAAANYLGAFSLNDLGMNVTGGAAATATLNGPGATNLLGLGGQQNSSGSTCADNAGNKFVCFNINPDIALAPYPINFLYTIDFSQNLNIAAAG